MPAQNQLSSRSYQTSERVWGGPIIYILSFDNKSIAKIPLNFVACGGVNTWSYVVSVVRELVNETDGWIYAVGNVPNILPVHPREPPFAGELFYLRPDHGSITFSRGPTYTTFAKPAEPDDAISAATTSLSNPDQQGFRNSLLARDGVCLLSGADYDRCHAVHIVPQSRDDVYREILKLRDHEPVGRKFETDAGLLLKVQFHSLFDRFDLSFYYLDGVMYAHFFRPRQGDLEFDLHGKAIPTSRFHRPFPDVWPNPDYLRWHYKQCVMARLRGFSA